jgi:hypothetical protein
LPVQQQRLFVNAENVVEHDDLLEGDQSKRCANLKSGAIRHTGGLFSNPRPPPSHPGGKTLPQAARGRRAAGRRRGTRLAC